MGVPGFAPLQAVVDRYVLYEAAQAQAPEAGKQHVGASDGPSGHFKAPPLTGETLIDEPACLHAFAGAALLGAQWRPQLLPPQFRSNPQTGPQAFAEFATAALLAADPAD